MKIMRKKKVDDAKQAVWADVSDYGAIEDSIVVGESSKLI